MSRIELTGLRADLPIGAMAAFGCLRVCERLPELRGSRLAWAERDIPHAVLTTPSDLDRASLAAALASDNKSIATRRELTWRDQIKTAEGEMFRHEANAVLRPSSAKDREAADWFAAFGTELVLNREGRIDSTPFDMSMARQRFLADAVKLASGLCDQPVKYEEALFGPWRYQDDQHSLGWDPSTMKLGAFTHKAPTAMANAGVSAAVWLAFESLSLFPCFYARRNPPGLHVRGFERERREYVFYWPVWDGEIGFDALQTLLSLDLTGVDATLRARGIRAVYRSARFKPNKYLACFRPPEVVWR